MGREGARPSARGAEDGLADASRGAFAASGSGRARSCALPVRACRSRRVAGQRICTRHDSAIGIVRSQSSGIGIAGGPRRRPSSGHMAARRRAKCAASGTSRSSAIGDARPSRNPDARDGSGRSAGHRCYARLQFGAGGGRGTECSHLLSPAVSVSAPVSIVSVVCSHDLTQRFQRRHPKWRGLHSRRAMTANPCTHRKAAPTQ